MQRHYSWALTYWCMCLAGPKMRTTQLIEFASRLNVNIDLVPYNLWDLVHAAGPGMPCVLPDMGKDADGNDIAPFVPNIGKPENRDRASAAYMSAIVRASNAEVPHVIAFTGMDRGGDRREQFKDIVRAFTASTPGDNSLKQLAEKTRTTILIEQLNLAWV